MRIYPESFEVVKELNKSLRDKKFEGRIADNGVNLIFLMSMIANAGNGDHLEIGTLFGASAIASALIKKKLDLSGTVYTIDSYDKEKRTKEIQFTIEDEEDLLNGSPQAAKKNFKLFDVNVKLIQKPSDPWPKELKDKLFVSAYIDGDHMHDMPYKDFKNLSELVSDYIAFDNYEEGYPDVLGGVNKILSENQEWVLFYKNASFLALRRRLPARGDKERGAYLMGSL